MKLLCSDFVSSSNHLTDSFPHTTQDSYKAYDIESQENTKDLPPLITCNTSHHTSLLNRQLTASSSLEKAIQGKRPALPQQVSSEESQNDLPESSEFHNRSNPISPEQRHRILAMLHQRMFKIQRAGNLTLFSAQQKNVIKNTTDSLIVFVFRTIQSIKSTSTLQKACQLLNTLNDQVMENLTPLQNIARPPLAAAFEDQASFIWVDIALRAKALKGIGLTQALSDANRQKVLAYLQGLISEMTQAKNLSTENLSDAYTQKLQTGFEERKNYVTRAMENIQTASNHQQVYTRLTNFRATAIQHTRSTQFLPILGSPERHHLQSHVFNISRELLQMRKNLGEPQAAFK